MRLAAHADASWHLAIGHSGPRPAGVCSYFHKALAQMDEGYNPGRNHVEDVVKSASRTIDDLEEAFRNRPAHGWTNKPVAA